MPATSADGGRCMTQVCPILLLFALPRFAGVVSSTNWRQDSPSAKRSQLALLWYSLDYSIRFITLVWKLSLGLSVLGKAKRCVILLLIWHSPFNE